MKYHTRFGAMVMALWICLPLVASVNITHVRNSLYSMGTIRSVEVADGHVFCAGAGNSLYVLDIADPIHPQYAGVYNSPGNVGSQDVHIAGNTAIMYQSNNVRWLDISNPAEPQLLGSASFPDNFSSQAVSGNFTFLTTSGGDLYCWDATTPQSPVLADSLAVPNAGQYTRIAVLGNRAYISGAGDWKVLDISDPYAITLVGTVPDTQNQYIAAHDDTRIYAVESLTLHIYQPNGMDGLTLCSSSISVYGDQIYGVCCGDGFVALNYVLVMGSQNISYWYMFVDVSDPSSPTVIRNTTYEGGGIDLSASKFFIFPGASIRIFNVGPGGSPLTPQGVFAQGAVIGITQNSAQIFIEDSSGYVKSLGNLDAPEPELLSMAAVDDVTDLVASDNLLVASQASYDIYGWLQGPATLRVYSISPSGILQYRYWHSFFANGGNSMCTGSQIVGQTGYFAVGYSLYAADLSSSSGMTELSEMYGYGINYVKVVGNRAYCGAYLDGGYKLLILDVSDPQSPAVMSSMPVPNEVLAIGVRYSRAYVGGNWPSLLTVDVADPFAPTVVSTIQTDSPVMVIAAGQNHITVLTENKLYVFDAGNGSAPGMKGWYDLAGYNYGMVVRDNLAYLAQGSYMGVYDIGAAIGLCTDTPQEPVPAATAVRACPNPFHDGTSIVFDVPRAAKAQAAVYNIRGQIVFVLPESDLRPGVNTTLWDGRDAGGNPLPNGIYILSGSVGQQRFTRKLTLLR